MTWVGLTNNEPYSGYPNQPIVYITVCVGLGILGAIIFMFFYCISLYFVGCKFTVQNRLDPRKISVTKSPSVALGGFYLAIFILSWREDLVIANVSCSFKST